MSHTKEPSTVSTSAMHSLSLEIRGKGTLAIRTVQEGPVSVGAECTRKHADITEHALLANQDFDRVANNGPPTSRGLSRILDILYCHAMSKSTCETRAATELPRSSEKQLGDSSGEVSKLCQCQHKS
jgi:hypothetical protein